MNRFVAGLILLVGVGCGGVHIRQFSVLEATRHVLHDDAAPTHARIDSHIAVTVLAPDEALNLRNSADDDRHYESFVLPEASHLTDEQLEEFQQEYFDQLRDEHGTRIVIQLAGFATALSEAVQHHLSQHFREVDVRAAPTATAGSLPLAASMNATWRMTKDASVTLRTDAPSNVLPVEGTGRRRSGPHLAWVIPVGLVLGLILTGLISGAVNRSHFRSAVARAIDDAAATWASEVASSYRERIR